MKAPLFRMSRCGLDAMWDEAERNQAGSGPQSVASHDLEGHAHHPRPQAKAGVSTGSTTVTARSHHTSRVSPFW